LQYIELLLFDTNPGKQKVQLNEQTMVIMESAKDLKLYYIILKSLIPGNGKHANRIDKSDDALYCGYDAPYLKSV